MFTTAAPPLCAKNREKRVMEKNGGLYRGKKGVIERVNGIYITQYGSTVYIGIAMVYQH